MTSDTVPPPVENAPPAAVRYRSDRFFAWVSGWGIARSEGWIGGVAAGVAARLRIDPLIVRGVFVVATLCGLPLILLYAFAWALLPDVEGRIHARSLLRRRFDPAQLGILAAFVLGLLTLAPLSLAGVWMRMSGIYVRYDYGFGAPGAFSILLGSALVIVLLVFIVRAARRTPGASLSDPRMASAATTAPDASASAGVSGNAGAADGRGADAEGHLAPDSVEGSASVPAPPLEPVAPANPDDLEAWRAQHAAWKEQDRAWREQQQDAERAAREQARREREEAAAVFSAEAAERRRIRRTAKPRASFASVATAIGVALVAGTVVWLGAPKPDAVTAALALFTATLVLAFAMIIAGVARRRSGFLAFITTITLIGALVTGFIGTLGNVRFGSVNVSNYETVDLRQPFGATLVHLGSWEGMSTRPVVIEKGDGYTEITVGEGVEVDLTATVGADASVQWQRMVMDADGSSTTSDMGSFVGTRLSDGTSRISETVRSAFSPTDLPEDPAEIVSVPVTLTQSSGRIYITYYVLADEETTE